MSEFTIKRRPLPHRMNGESWKQMGMRMPSKCKAAGSALVCVCLCGAVVIRICSNHIQPPLFSQSETNSHTHTHIQISMTWWWGRRQGFYSAVVVETFSAEPHRSLTPAAKPLGCRAPWILARLKPGRASCWRARFWSFILCRCHSSALAGEKRIRERCSFENGFKNK